MNVSENLKQLRAAMQQAGLDAYLINGFDPHGSCYPAEHWESRNWIIGFSGSAGTIVVTANQAGLWTDFRYHQQAEEELEHSPVELFRSGNPDVPRYQDWLRANLSAGQRVGIDASTIAAQEFSRLAEELQQHRIQLDGQALSLDKLSFAERPPLPDSEIFAHDICFAGVSRGDKLARLRHHLQQQSCSCIVISELDSIAWLLNLRGGDVKQSPVFLSYLVVLPTKAHLFVNRQLSPQLQLELEQQNISIGCYRAAEEFIANLTAETVLADNSVLNQQIYHNLSKNNFLCNLSDPIRQWKSCKNAGEIDCLRQTMIKDGVALVCFQYWLEESLRNPTTALNEHLLSEELSRYRLQQDDCHGDSFAAIIGYCGNGAKPHYRCTAASAAPIRATGLLLIDSGGQYSGGTTDITRTWSLGQPTAKEKRDYTIVLKSHIALSRLRFPVAAQGMQLDGITRSILWQHGLNYAHGTGHGVGFFLNVHESPPTIGPNISNSPIVKGMVISNEPALYRQQQYGIRIENLLLTIADEYFDNFLRFETLSICHYDINLIDVSLLERDEIYWINTYHQNCFAKLSPWLRPAIIRWLEQRCQALG